MHANSVSTQFDSQSVSLRRVIRWRTCYRGVSRLTFLATLLLCTAHETHLWAQYDTGSREYRSRAWQVSETPVESSVAASPAMSPPAPLPAQARQRALPITFSTASKSATVAPASAMEPVEQAIPLAPPSEKRSRSLSAPKSSTGGVISTMFGGLGVVLGLFFLFVWFTRKATPRGMAPLPKEVVEPLGRAPLAGRQTLQMLRVGNKLLLLCVAPHGVETLTEITDPDEVERISSLCQQTQPGSMSASFRQVLTELGNEPTAPGFLGDPNRDEFALAGGGRRRRLRRGDDE